MGLRLSPEAGLRLALCTLRCGQPPQAMRPQQAAILHAASRMQGHPDERVWPASFPMPRTRKSTMLPPEPRSRVLAEPQGRPRQRMHFTSKPQPLVCTIIKTWLDMRLCRDRRERFLPRLSETTALDVHQCIERAPRNLDDRTLLNKKRGNDNRRRT